MMVLWSAACLIAASWWSDPANLFAAAKAALGLGFVIFVHELGHFLVAKACGVKCEKFYVGFDVPLSIGPLKLPSSLFKKQWGETEYGIGIIPLGGYVKMLGQDDNPGNQAKENERLMTADGKLDPRSYPAKSVPQRMAIISAGVIMNLIFAVIFATAAYWMGVKYTPCKIGSTIPGDPAWEANLMPGDKLVQLGRDGERSDNLRFTYDLRLKVIETGAGNPCEFLVQHADGTEEWVTVRPSTSLKDKNGGLPTIGVFSMSSNTIEKTTIKLDTPFEATDLTQGEQITAIQFGDRRYEVEDGVDIRRLFVRHADEVAQLTVLSPQEEAEKSGKERTTRTVELGVRPMRTVGIVPEMGEIVGIQNASPAAQAGLQTGDRLLSLQGEPIGNPLTLESRLLKLVGQEIALTVNRKGAEQEVTITPRFPDLTGSARMAKGPAALETLGIAFRVTPKIAVIEPGSPAAEAGLQPGDQLAEVSFDAPAENKDARAALRRMRLQKPLDVTSGEASWLWLSDAMQDLPGEFKVNITVNRRGATKSVALSPITDSDRFSPSRGLPLRSYSQVRTADSMSEALSLGVRETKEGIGQVFLTLKKIKDLFRNLGGPGTIAVAAASEASAGWPRLFIFLTLLSANLAVLNFLPIPVLDGGHMMFLAYEGLVGKPVNERIAFGLTMFGLSLILGLMVYVIGMDVYRLGFSG